MNYYFKWRKKTVLLETFNVIEVVRPLLANISTIVDIIRNTRMYGIGLIKMFLVLVGLKQALEKRLIT